MRPVSKNTVDHQCSLSIEMTSRYSFFTKFCGFHCGHKKNTTITDYNSHCVAAGNVFGPLWNTSRSPNGLVCHQRDISDDKVFNCHALTMHNDLSNPISAAERAIPPPQWWSGERGGLGSQQACRSSLSSLTCSLVCMVLSGLGVHEVTVWLCVKRL